jgi:MFS family permease
VLRLFADRNILLMTAIFFICNLCLYGLGFWLPSLIAASGVKDPFTIGLMASLPSLCGIVTMVLVSRSSDRFRERRWHLAGLYLLGALGLVLSTVWANNPALALFSLCLATMGLIAIPPLFWNLPTALLSGVSAAAGLAIINSFANLSGFFGPAIVGWAVALTGGTASSILFLAATLVLGALMILAIPARLVNSPGEAS